MQVAIHRLAIHVDLDLCSVPRLASEKGARSPWLASTDHRLQPRRVSTNHSPVAISC